jgi:hypothetical protein
MTIGEELQRLAVALPGGMNTEDRIDALASVLATLSNAYFNIKTSQLRFS